MEIRAVLTPELEIAAAWLFGDGIAADHFLQMIASGSFDPSHVFVALRGDEICGAIIAEPLPGRIAVLCPPRVNDLATADALMEAALNHLRSRGVRLAQAYLEPAIHPVAFERHGFHSATRIQQWVYDAGEPKQWVGPVLHFASSFDLPTFQSTLLSTYEGSLDAPEANVGASAEEILQGYGPLIQRWLVFRGESPIGVLFLGEYGSVGQIEYFGVVPSARGQGMGSAMLHHALNHCLKRAIPSVRAMVDARNRHAIRLYEALGFRVRKVQNLWLRHLP